jgi:two-component system, sensor histidine kinase and response regulator
MAGETILVVDDEPAVLELLQELLELGGYRVETAGTGREGLTVLERVDPQLIVSDISMPEMDGYQFYTEVRARPRWIGLPFIFLTGRDAKVEVREGKKLGVDEYLTKPVQEEDLLVAVRSRLDRRAQLEAAQVGQVERLKRTILATLNHEFRTPLTWLVGYGELLRESGPEVSPEKLKVFVEGILAGTERLQRLVEDLVLLVDLHSDAARQTFERHRRVMTSIPALLQEVVSREQARAAARKVRLVVVVPEELPAVMGTPELLAHAVSRLLDNGIKFSKSGGGDVTLVAQGIGARLLIQVKDQGIGIPADERDRITELFHQVGRAINEQQGWGTGLTIVRGVVRLHGGTLGVASEVGRGSTFTIQLPVVPGPPGP